MIRNGQKWVWILTKSDLHADDREILGVFAWVGAAMGYVKHLTGNEDREWNYDEKGIMLTWTSVLDENDELFVIKPARFSPLVRK